MYKKFAGAVTTRVENVGLVVNFLSIRLAIKQNTLMLIFFLLRFHRLSAAVCYNISSYLPVYQDEWKQFDTNALTFSALCNIFNALDGLTEFAFICQCLAIVLQWICYLFAVFLRLLYHNLRSSASESLVYFMWNELQPGIPTRWRKSTRNQSAAGCNPWHK